MKTNDQIRKQNKYTIIGNPRIGVYLYELYLYIKSKIKGDINR